jgi:membrane protease YdiL (CAAX protease family)
MSFFSSLWQILSGKPYPLGQFYSVQDTAIRIVQAIALCLWMSVLLWAIASQFVSDIPDSAHLISEFLKKVSPLQAVMTIAIVGPIMEEMMFRVWLRPTRWSLSISLGIISVWIMTFFLSLFAPDMTWDDIVERWSLIGILNRILPIILGIGLRYLLLGRKFFQSFMTMIKTHRYPTLWITSILFGWAHITNFTDKSMWYLLPILTLPQTLIGFVLWAMRLQGKRRHTMIIHCVYNGLLIVPIVMLMRAGIWIEQLSDLTDLEKLTSWQQMAAWLSGVFMMMLFVSVLVVNGYSIWEYWKRQS